MELLRARRCGCWGIHSRNDRLPPPYRPGGAAHLPRGSRARAIGRGPLAPLSQVTGLPQTPCRHCDLSSNGTSASAAFRAFGCRRSVGGRLSHISRRRTPCRSLCCRIGLLWIKARLRRARRACACGLRPFTARPAPRISSPGPRAFASGGASRLRDDEANSAGIGRRGRGASSRLPLSPVRTYQEPPEGPRSFVQRGAPPWPLWRLLIALRVG